MFKQRIRQMIGRSGGRSMLQVVQKLRPYLLSWKAYFGLSQTPGVWRRLEEWLRHRLRALQFKQCKHRRPWPGAGGRKPRCGRPDRGQWPPMVAHSGRLLNSVLDDLAWFDGWACPDSPDLNLSNRPVQTRTPSGVAGAQPTTFNPLAICSRARCNLSAVTTGLRPRAAVAVNPVMVRSRIGSRSN